MARKKLPLNRPFALADKQVQTDDRLFYEDRRNPDNKIYYPTGKRGSGTGDYNSGLTALGSSAVLPRDGRAENKEKAGYRSCLFMMW